MNDSPAEFKSLRAVHRYLTVEGWKIGKSALADHAKTGKLRPDERGLYTLKAIEAYARTFLTLASTRQKLSDEALQRRKIELENALREEQFKRERLKRLTEEGRHIPRDQFELELAARAAVLYTQRKNSIQAQASERVALVHGDPVRIPDLMAYDLAALDEEMNQFATMKEFHVIFEATTQGETPNGDE